MRDKKIDDYDDLKCCPNCVGMDFMFECDGMCCIRVRCISCRISGPPALPVHEFTDTEKDEAVKFWNELRRT